MTTIDLFRQFYRMSKDKNYPASVKLLYYTLLGEWNEQHRPEKLRVTNRYVSELSGYALSTVNETLRKLASYGFLSYTRKANSTWITFKESETQRKQAERKPNVRVREENKQEVKSTPAVEVLKSSPDGPAIRPTKIMGKSVAELIRLLKKE